MTARFSEAESPQAHLRNALQILRMPSAEYGGWIVFSDADVAAIDRRLSDALTRLGSTLYVLPVTPSLLQDLEAMRANSSLTVTPPMTCVVCGCDEMHACSIDPREMTEEDRASVVEYFVNSNLLLPDQVPCSWAQQDPPLCTNPKCRRQYAEATA